ncbi:Hemin uptake protein hemP [compost metagenome]
MNERHRQREGIEPDRLPKDRSRRRCIPSRTLLGDARELVIEHEGIEYVLRLTRQNKLILTK